MRVQDTSRLETVSGLGSNLRVRTLNSFACARGAESSHPPISTRYNLRLIYKKSYSTQQNVTRKATARSRLTSDKPGDTKKTMVVKQMNKPTLRCLAFSFGPASTTGSVAFTGAFLPEPLFDPFAASLPFLLLLPPSMPERYTYKRYVRSVRTQMPCESTERWRVRMHDACCMGKYPQSVAQDVCVCMCVCANQSVCASREGWTHAGHSDSSKTDRHGGCRGTPSSCTRWRTESASVKRANTRKQNKNPEKEHINNTRRLDVCTQILTATHNLHALRVHWITFRSAAASRTTQVSECFLWQQIALATQGGKWQESAWVAAEQAKNVQQQKVS